jgi:hypothetical protein
VKPLQHGEVVRPLIPDSEHVSMADASAKLLIMRAEAFSGELTSVKSRGAFSGISEFVLVSNHQLLKISRTIAARNA